MASFSFNGHRLASVVANLVPRPLMNGLCFTASTICLLFDRRGRRAVYANLRTLFGTTGRRYGHLGLWRQVWHIFINYGKFMVEFFGDKRFDKRWLDRRFDVRGIEHLRRATARRRGCIVLSAHFGNWELLGGKLIRLGFRGAGAGEEWPDPELSRMLTRFRSNRGYYMYTYAGAARGMLGLLRSGCIVFLLGDRNVSTDAGVEVEFLGRKVRFPHGPGRLALAADVPLVPIFARRLPDDRIEATCFPPIEPPPAAEGMSRDERVRAMAQAFARDFEEILRICPHQWNGAFIEDLGTRAGWPHPVRGEK